MPEISPLETHASLHHSLGEQVDSQDFKHCLPTISWHVLCARHTWHLVVNSTLDTYQRPSLHLRLLSMLQTHIPICLLEISFLIARKHLKLSVSQSEFISLLPKPAPPSSASPTPGLASSSSGGLNTRSLSIHRCRESGSLTTCNSPVTAYKFSFLPHHPGPTTGCGERGTFKESLSDPC